MNNMNKNRCFKSADILLPNFDKTDAEKWAVIACDQFTSEEEYWQEAKELVGDAPSTLELILPEVYLKDTDKLIPKINSKMKEYLSDILVCRKDTVIYTERVQSDGKTRCGIVLAVDLEAYDFTKGANSLIRATEATVIDRIPPRVKIRKDAPIELPHVMLLIDDPEGTVIEPLTKNKAELCPAVAYSTPLMLGGGSIEGRFLTKEAIEQTALALDALITPDAMAKRYSDPELSPLLFAVGDGNHSLATAKTIYEGLKRDIGDEALSHPARYALAEVVNIHDSALEFEPIYRVVFGADADDLINSFKSYTQKLCGSFDSQSIQIVTEGGEGLEEITADRPEKTLPVATLQAFLDCYVNEHEGVTVDYIHGTDSVKKLSQNGAVGFIFTGMGKNELFKTVIYDGSLPRKTFSMGHAQDKRYYLEARKITKD